MHNLDVESTAAWPGRRGWMSALASVEPWSQLAALRFVLAAIVAVNHLGEYVSLGVLDWVRRMGAFEAILGFLLVSGYSIGASYQRAPEGFAWRRVRRIYPVYLVSLVVTWGVTHSVLEQAVPGPLALLANVLLLNQLVTQTARSDLRPWRSLQWLGDVSYPLFLLHIPVFMVLSQTQWRSPTIYLATALLLAALVLVLLSGLQRFWPQAKRSA